MYVYMYLCITVAEHSQECSCTCTCVCTIHACSCTCTLLYNVYIHVHVHDGDGHDIRPRDTRKTTTQYKSQGSHLRRKMRCLGWDLNLRLSALRSYQQRQLQRRLQMAQFPYKYKTKPDKHFNLDNSNLNVVSHTCKHETCTKGLDCLCSLLFTSTDILATCTMYICGCA